MSTQEILAELPKLSLDEVELIYHRAETLLHDEASPELVAAIDQADAEPHSDDISLEQMRDQVRRWAHSA